ncbi:M24 family metallopeptidase, partial [Mesorhizobium sp. M1217]|uniref:M24 family metallopeptidase n=1 Tax=Mesorhizobium sp. M1217 TaxID=2957070 RepID=UPI00333BAED1
MTAHGHLRYLTGYNGNGGYFAPFPLIMVPGQRPTYVVREFEVSTVQAEGCIDEIICYSQQQDFATVCADVLRRYGLQGRKVGFELGCWNLAPADVSAIQAQLPDMKVADATRLVASVCAVKSPLEIEAMRGSMALTDIAVRTFQSSLREGVTEAEVSMKIQEELYKAGGAIYEALPTLVFGDRTKLAHGSPTRNKLRQNDPALMETGAVKHGYVAGLARTAV